MAVSRQVESQHRIKMKGICPQCGTKACEIDPRYQRDNEIRAAAHAGQPSAQIAKRYGITARLVRYILTKPAGRPRMLSRCKGCRKKRLKTPSQAISIAAAIAPYIHGSPLPPAA